MYDKLLARKETRDINGFITVTSFYHDGSCIECITNLDGVTVQEIWFKADGKKHRELSFYENGTLASESVFHKDGTYEILFYDTEGNVIPDELL